MLASSLPFGCYWRDLFNRFLLHARHVLRAVASGQEAGATSGRAAIGGRGCAARGSAWSTHAARAGAPCPGPASGGGLPGRGRGRGTPEEDHGARREGCCDDARGLPVQLAVLELSSTIRCFCRLCALRYSCWRGSHATVNAGLCCCSSFMLHGHR